MKKHLIIAISLSISFVILSFFSVAGFQLNNLRYSGSAITTDELAHIASGYYYLKTGRYFLNVEHPPLVKDLSSLPLVLINPIFPKIYQDFIITEGYAWEHYPPQEFIFSKNLEIRNAQWDFARIFLFNPQNNPDVIALWSRLSIIVFNALSLFLLYLTVAKSWTARAATISLFLIVFSQFNLAHGSLVTMDVMSSVLQMLALFSFAHYIKNVAERKKTISSFVATALFLSLALLSKFSSAILIPSMFIGGVIYITIAKKHWRDFFQYIARFTCLVMTALLFISVFYYAHTFNMDGSDMVAQIHYYYPHDLPFGIKEVLTTFVFSNPLLKGLAQYANGVLMVFSRMNSAHQQIFFMGNVYGSEGAGLMYFPILYFSKLSIGLLVLNLISFLIIALRFTFSKDTLSRRVKSFFNNPASFLITVFIFFYSATTLSSNLQIGLRHIMPIILGLTILTAKTIDSFWDKNFLKIKFSSLFSIIFVVIFLSVLNAFPNYLSYYNYFAGGKERGYKIATDSNFDWGQDAKKLIRWIDENDIKKIYIDIEGNIPLQWYIGDAYRVLDVQKYPHPEAGSYIAVAISKYELKKYDFPLENLISHIGSTILIFKL